MSRFAPTTNRVSQIAAVLLAAVLALPATLKSGEPPTAASGKPALYDPQADASRQIADAVIIAKREHKRVLLMFGYNQCIWCHRLHGLFKSDRVISRKLLYEYELVMIDNGRLPDRSMNNAAVNARFGNPDKINGWPVLVVLDAAGKQLTTQETAALEEGDHHVPAKVLAFLEKWQAPPVSAEDILAQALSKAKAESKRAFVYFSAPWCGYCHKLDAYLRTPEIATVFNTTAQSHFLHKSVCGPLRCRVFVAF